MTKIDASNLPTQVLLFPRPTFHNIIVEPLQSTYDGILHIPEGVKGKPTEGMIIAVGPGRRTPEGQTVPVAFSPGQRIIYNQYSGSEIDYNGKKYLIVAEDEVKAVFPASTQPQKQNGNPTQIKNPVSS